MRIWFTHFISSIILSFLNRPAQPYPSRAAWQMWKKYLDILINPSSFLQLVTQVDDKNALIRKESGYTTNTQFISILLMVIWQNVLGSIHQPLIANYFNSIWINTIIFLSSSYHLLIIRQQQLPYVLVWPTHIDDYLWIRIN